MHLMWPIIRHTWLTMHIYLYDRLIVNIPIWSRFTYIDTMQGHVTYFVLIIQKIIVVSQH